MQLVPQKRLFLQLSRGYKICYPRQPPNSFVLEKRNQKLQEKKAHKHMMAMQLEQTRINENAAIEAYDASQLALKQRKLQRWRNNIAVQSQLAQEYISEQSKKDEKRQQAYLSRQLEEENQHQNRVRMVRALTLDSQYWFNLDNLESSMNQHMLIPNMIYDKTDYYVRLQEQAMLLENAHYDKLDEGVNNAETLRFKNKRLIPLFAEIKGIVKHLNNDWETQYSQELAVAQSRVEQQHGHKGDLWVGEQQALLAEVYAQIVQKEKTERAGSLDELERQAVMLYNLVVLWQQYIHVVKMDNKRVQVMRQLEEEKTQTFYQANNPGQESEAVDYEWNMQDQERSEDVEANEKLTTQDEELLDAEDHVMRRNFKQTQVDQKIETYTRLTENEKKDIFSQYSTKEKTDSKIQQLFSQWEEQADEEAEEEGQKEGDSQGMYGYVPESYKIDQQAYYDQQVDQLAKLFPAESVADLADFSAAKLKYPSVSSVLEAEQRGENSGVLRRNVLNTSVLVEMLKGTLREQQATSRRAKQLYQLLDVLAEVTLQEGPLLNKLLTVYHPSNYNA